MKKLFVLFIALSVAVAIEVTANVKVKKNIGSFLAPGVRNIDPDKLVYAITVGNGYIYYDCKGLMYDQDGDGSADFNSEECNDKWYKKRILNPEIDSDVVLEELRRVINKYYGSKMTKKEVAEMLLTNITVAGSSKKLNYIAGLKKNNTIAYRKRWPKEGEKFVYFKSKRILSTYCGNIIIDVSDTNTFGQQYYSKIASTAPEVSEEDDLYYSGKKEKVVVNSYNTTTNNNYYKPPISSVSYYSNPSYYSVPLLSFSVGYGYGYSGYYGRGYYYPSYHNQHYNNHHHHGGGSTYSHPRHSRSTNIVNTNRYSQTQYNTNRYSQPKPQPKQYSQPRNNSYIATNYRR